MHIFKEMYNHLLHCMSDNKEYFGFQMYKFE